MSASAGGVTYTIAHDALEPRYQMTGSNATVRRWAWAGSRLVRETKAGVATNLLPGSGTETLAIGAKFAVNDEHGSVVGLADGVTGTVSGLVYRYGANGEPDTGGTPGVIGYAGGLDLPELGLVLFGARVYSTGIGRFLQTDPIGLAGGTNVYGYAGGDPVNGVDPSGLAAPPKPPSYRLHCQGGGICVDGYPYGDPLFSLNDQLRDENTDWIVFLNSRDNSESDKSKQPDYNSRLPDGTTIRQQVKTTLMRTAVAAVCGGPIPFGVVVAATVLPRGQFDFKNNIRGQDARGPSFLSDAGNFAYAAYASAIAVQGASTLGARLCAQATVALGLKNPNTVDPRTSMDKSASRAVPRGNRNPACVR